MTAYDARTVEAAAHIRLGTKVKVLADELPAAYREDWRDFEGYVSSTAWCSTNGVVYEVSEEWPPRNRTDGFAPNEIEALPVSPVPTPSDALGETVEKLREALAKVDLPLVQLQDSKGFSRVYSAPEEPHFRTGDLLAETFGDGDDLIVEAINALPTLLTALEQRQDGLERFSDDARGVQSRIIIVHQLRASADIQDSATKRETGWADTSDRAQLMRKAADAIERLATPLPMED